MSGLIDTTTGEWWEDQKAMKASKKKKDNRDKLYVGLECPYPKDCLEPDTLFNCVRQIDNYLNSETPVEIDHAYLLESMVKGFLNPKKADALVKLSNCIVAWNYGFTTKKYLLALSGETPKNYSRWVNDMSPYFKLEQTHPGVDHYKVIFNPIVAWRGVNTIREEAIRMYYTPTGGVIEIS